MKNMLGERYPLLLVYNIENKAFSNLKKCLIGFNYILLLLCLFSVYLI